DVNAKVKHLRCNDRVGDAVESVPDPVVATVDFLGLSQRQVLNVEVGILALGDSEFRLAAWVAWMKRITALVSEDGLYGHFETFVRCHGLLLTLSFSPLLSAAIAAFNFAGIGTPISARFSMMLNASLPM